jgi:hypothetical protein
MEGNSERAGVGGEGGDVERKPQGPQREEEEQLTGRLSQDLPLQLYPLWSLGWKQRTLTWLCFWGS